MRKFRLDRENGKLWGVCAGISNMTGWDVTLVRVGLVLVTIAGAFPWTLIAYGVAAWAAKPRSRFAEERKPAARISTYDVKHKMTDLDRRMMEVESHVAGPESRLAKEIEALR
jgi:phage shock protein C